MDNLDLTYLVNTFGENNEKLKELKKVCDGKNAEIKEIMAAQNISAFNTDYFNATYIVKETVKVDEDKLLALLQEKGGDTFRNLGIIKTKEYVDDDALEAAIYNSLIDKDLLLEIKNCSNTVKTPTLTVKKKRGMQW